MSFGLAGCEGPAQGEFAYIAAGDLVQRAVAPAFVIAAVLQPVGGLRIAQAFIGDGRVDGRCCVRRDPGQCSGDPDRQARE